MCTVAVLCIAALMSDLHARTEDIRYLFNATGHGWVCLRCNEQMNIERYSAGAYPDGTRVIVLEERRDDLFATPRNKVQIGRAVGWVFGDELLTENEWLQKKESGQYVPFQNHWHVNDNSQSLIDLYESPSLFDAETIGTVNESSFIALGIYRGKIHVQLNDMDGYMLAYNCIPDITKPDITYHDREVRIWSNATERAIKKTKGADEANYTEEERGILKLMDPIDPMSFKSSREIMPTGCDITSAEAERMIWQVLIEEGYVTDDIIALFESAWCYLYYDYDDHNKHIWLFNFSNENSIAETEFVTNITVDLDAHTGEIINIAVCGP